MRARARVRVRVKVRAAEESQTLSCVRIGSRTQVSKSSERTSVSNMQRCELKTKICRSNAFVRHKSLLYRYPAGGSGRSADKGGYAGVRVRLEVRLKVVGDK